MTTITINNPKIEKIIEQKYTNIELEKKFLVFIQKEITEEKVELFEISVNELWEGSEKKLKNIDKTNFINY